MQHKMGREVQRNENVRLGHSAVQSEDEPTIQPYESQKRSFLVHRSASSFLVKMRGFSVSIPISKTRCQYLLIQMSYGTHSG